MTEIIDSANEYAQADIDAVLLAARRRFDDTANDRRDCIDCVDLIGHRRKAAKPSAIRCVSCQTDFEKGKR